MSKDKYFLGPAADRLATQPPSRQFSLKLHCKNCGAAYDLVNMEHGVNEIAIECTRCRAITTGTITLSYTGVVLHYGLTIETVDPFAPPTGTRGPGMSKSSR